MSARPDADPAVAANSAFPTGDAGTMVAPAHPEPRAPRPQWLAFYRDQARLIWEWRATRLALLRRLVLTFVAGALSFALVAYLLPGIRVAGPVPLLLAAALLTGANSALRPALLLVLSPFPVLVLQLVGTVAEVLLMIAIGALVPGIAVDGPTTAVLAGVILASLIGLFSEIVRASDDDSYHGTQVRRLAAREFGRREPVTSGLLVVQLDGLALPILEAQFRSGRMATLAGLVRAGTHRLDAWHPLLPPVTPASQAGILHGNNDDVPGFRWFEKSTRRMIVANTPEGAEAIERRVSDGRGLLASDGASIGNLVTGDATRSYLTMASLTGEGASREEDPRRLHGIFVSQVNYVRLVVLTIGELVKELYQRERQRARAVEPRIHRGRHDALERALTNVSLRHLTTALVIEEMFSGAPVIYVDYTGYDALAHHAGPERLEALDALDGLDRTLGSLIRVCRETPRPYRLVVLSDHGQCLGETFQQRFSESLAAAVGRLMGEGTTVASDWQRPREHGGTARMVFGELSRGPGVRPALTRRAIRATRRAALPVDHPSAVVCPSGSLANVYFSFVERRATLEEIEARHPGVIDGLLACPGVAFVLARSSKDGPLVIGHAGRRALDSGAITGVDPLLDFGPLALPALRRLDGFANTGDLVLMGAFDPASGEVVSFEEVVGSHGGLGGWQGRPFLFHPVDLPIDQGPLVGAVAVHAQLRSWIDGLADPLRRPDGNIVPAEPPAVTPDANVRPQLARNATSVERGAEAERDDEVDAAGPPVGASHRSP